MSAGLLVQGTGNVREGCVFEKSVDDRMGYVLGADLAACV
jgi:hypothetical protein